MHIKRARPNIVLAAWVFGLLLMGAVIAKGERLPVKTFSASDGLAHNEVRRIVRDSRGFLWFCTFEGLSRFDGYAFTSYDTNQGLPSAVINDLLETREGEYWVATDAGLCIFNPNGIARRITDYVSVSSRAMFTVYLPGSDSRSKVVTSLLQDHAGRIWCGTSRGLYKVEQQDGRIAFQFIELGMPDDVDTDVTALIEDSRYALWIGSTSGLYRIPQGGQAHRYSDHDGLPGNHIHSVLEDRESRLWVGTRHAGLCRLVADPGPSGTVVARVYSAKEGLSTLWITQVFQASDGSLWAGSNRGLVSFVPTSSDGDVRFRTYAELSGLPELGVQALAEDRNGNLWLGTGNSGAVKMSRSGITAFRDGDGIPKATTMFKDKNEDYFYVLTEALSGKRLVQRFDGERFAAIELNLPIGSSYGWGWNQTLLVDHEGEWWVGTAVGLCRFPKMRSFDRLGRTAPRIRYTKRDGLPGNNILSLFEDSRGDIWIGTADRHGLARWDRSTQTFHSCTERDGLPSLDYFYPTSYGEDRAGAVWIGFNFGGGLVRYRDGRFMCFTPADGLPEGGIFNLFLDTSGRLWVPTTRGGVCRIDHPEAEVPQFRNYTVADGVSSNDVKAITEDRWGRIYLGTGRGIDRLDPVTSHIRHYGTSEGVLLGDFNSALGDRDGNLWFGMSAGLVRLVPEADQEPEAPRVLITGLRIGGDEQQISAIGELKVPTGYFSATKNNFQIDFVAPGFSPGEGLRYQYSLLGAGSDWSPPSEGRTLNFANLAPGSYRFQVRAVNRDGVISEVPASFSFTIIPPIWQRWWFAATVAGLVGLLAYSLYRYRLARLIELERVRTHIAADLHDDIGSSLSQIAVLSEVIRRKAGEESRFTWPLAEIANISREAVDSMSDIVWAINPDKDSLNDLAQRMRRHASHVFPASNIEFSFNAPKTEKELWLGADVRRQMFLIFKESVNNIIKHSDCNRAEFEMGVEGDWVVLVVRDNGKGMALNNTTGGNGLISMRRRAGNLGGSVEINSNDGTTLTLRIPRNYPRARRPHK